MSHRIAHSHGHGHWHTTSHTWRHSSTHGKRSRRRPSPWHRGRHWWSALHRPWTLSTIVDPFCFLHLTPGLGSPAGAAAARRRPGRGSRGRAAVGGQLWHSNAATTSPSENKQNDGSNNGSDYAAESGLADSAAGRCWRDVGCVCSASLLAGPECDRKRLYRRLRIVKPSDGLKEGWGTFYSSLVGGRC